MLQCWDYQATAMLGTQLMPFDKIFTNQAEKDLPTMLSTLCFDLTLKVNSFSQDFLVLTVHPQSLSSTFLNLPPFCRQPRQLSPLHDPISSLRIHCQLFIGKIIYLCPSVASCEAHSTHLCWVNEQLYGLDLFQVIHNLFSNHTVGIQMVQNQYDVFRCSHFPNNSKNIKLT